MGTINIAILTYLNMGDERQAAQAVHIRPVLPLLGDERDHLLRTQERGVMIDSEHLTNLAMNFVVCLVGSAISSGPSMAPSGEFFFKPSSAAKAGIIFCFFAMTFWFFDVANLGGMSKYMTTFPAQNATFFNGNRWFVVCIAETMIYLMFAIAYGNNTDRRALLTPTTLSTTSLQSTLVRKGISER